MKQGFLHHFKKHILGKVHSILHSRLIKLILSMRICEDSYIVCFCRQDFWFTLNIEAICYFCSAGYILFSYPICDCRCGQSCKWWCNTFMGYHFCCVLTITLAKSIWFQSFPELFFETPFYEILFMIVLVRVSRVWTTDHWDNAVT